MQEHQTGSLMIEFPQLNNEDNRSAGYTVLMIMLAVIYSVAVMAGTFAVFGVESGYLPLVLICSIYSVFLNLLWNFKKAFMFKVAAGVLPAATTLAAGSFVRNGFALIGNGVLKTVGAENKTIYLPFSVTCSEAEYGVCITVICCILAAWITLLCVHMLRDNNRPAALMLTVMMLALNMMYGNDASWGWMISSCICAIAVITKAFLEDKITGCVKDHSARGTLFALCILVLTSGIMLAAVKPAEYEKPQVFSRLTDRISESIYSARYGAPDIRPLPSGDFENLKDLKMSDIVMLEVTADEHESLYLRGFVGSEYTGDGWAEVSGEELYGHSETLYWNHKDGMYGQSQIASAAQVLDKKAAEKQISVTIETKGADRHFYYTPYEMTALTDDGEAVLNETMLSDSSITPDGWSGQDTYEFTTLENQVKRYPSLVAQLQESRESKSCEQYLINESHYNAFVYETYTELSDEAAELMENHLKPYEAGMKEDEKHLNYTLAKQIILDYLNKNVTYAEEIAQRSEDADFVTDFVEISRSGYSVHYATTAALMFRYYGIPSRYVEGYLITPDKARSAKGGETVSITGKDAHAWVEYYQDGIGWIPFEVTPPYMDVMEQPELLTAAGSGGVSGQGSGAAMEMAQDNYEPEEPQKAEDKKAVPWNRIIAGTMLLLMIALAAAVIVRLILRKKKLNELNRSFEMEDRNASVINLYVYILTLQNLLDEKSEMRIYSIYQKAAFSAEQVSADEKQQTEEYKDWLLQRIVKECKLRKRFVYRWIKGIY